MIELLFNIGVMALAVFMVLFLIRFLIMRRAAAKLIRRGILPRRIGNTTTSRPRSAGGLTSMTKKETEMLFLIVIVVLLHGLFTNGVEGLVKGAVGLAVITWLGPLVTSAFWRGAGSDDALARACHTTLNIAVGCLTFPLLTLL